MKEGHGHSNWNQSVEFSNVYHYTKLEPVEKRKLMWNQSGLLFSFLSLSFS